jgi:hypothetical protein
VPQKIRVFAWRLATDSLAVTSSLHRRIPRILPICSVCGVKDEDAHHCMVRCTLARALRDGMRNVWSLPTETEFGSFSSWMVSQRKCASESSFFSGGPDITGIMSFMATVRPPLRLQSRSFKAMSYHCMQMPQSLTGKESRPCFLRVNLVMQ